MQKLFGLMLSLFWINIAAAQSPAKDTSAPGTGAVAGLPDSEKVQIPAGLQVAPATVDFATGQGQTSVQKITVTNNLTYPVDLKCYFSDWLRDSVGGHVYMDAGAYRYSCARWMTIDKPLMHLEPGKSEIVTVKVQMPDSADAVKNMTWTMLFIQTVKEQAFGPLASRQMRAGMNNQYRMGVHIYQTPPNVTRKAIKMLSFGKGEKAGQYRFVCQNTGAKQLEVKGYLEISPVTANSQEQKIKVGPKNFPLFPDQKRLVQMAIPETLAKGKYVITAAVDAGNDVPLEAAQGTIEIK